MGWGADNWIAVASCAQVGVLTAAAVYARRAVTEARNLRSVQTRSEPWAEGRPALLAAQPQCAQGLGRPPSSTPDHPSPRASRSGDGVENASCAHLWEPGRSALCCTTVPQQVVVGARPNPLAVVGGRAEPPHPGDLRTGAALRVAAPRKRSGAQSLILAGRAQP